VRKYDDVAQRQHRIGSGLTRNEWWSRLSAGHGPKSFLGIIPRFGANTLCYLAPYSAAYGAGQIGKIVAKKKEDSPCSRPVEPIIEQAHRGELVLAGAQLENDPVRNLLGFPDIAW
jgi:hypothetical protein